MLRWMRLLVLLLLLMTGGGGRGGGRGGRLDASGSREYLQPLLFVFLQGT